MNIKVVISMLSYKIILFLQFIILFTLFSCSQPTQQEKDLKKTINSEAKLNQFEYVLKQGAIILYNEFREQFDYLSLIYLRDGCQPCYPTFIEWQQKMDSISSPDNHTLLFIIQGDSYSDFMSRALNYEYIEDRYYMILDPENKFSNDNNKIPYWILDSGILVDKENKIKMVGKPWVNDDMLKLFHKTIDYKENNKIPTYIAASLFTAITTFNKKLFSFNKLTNAMLKTEELF